MNDDLEFEQHRPRLIGYAYRMLGSRSEAEDVIQDAYLRWQERNQGVGQDHIMNTQAFLMRIVSNLCIDRLRALKKERETYIGPWLAEPVLSPLEDEPAAGAQSDPLHLAMMAEEMSLGLMLALEQLNPVERAVFLLRSAFDLDFDEISSTIGKTPDNCRQLYSRARRALDIELQPAPPRPEQLRVFDAFIHACQSGELDDLLSMLAEDVALYSDGGGKAKAAPVPIRSSAHVARFLLSVMQKVPSDFESRFAWINGEPGLVALSSGQPFGTVSVSLRGSVIQHIYFQVNPDKLASIMQEV